MPIVVFLLSQFGGERTKIHRFVLNNTTKTPLSLKVNVQAPFQLISTEPPPSAKSGRSLSADMVTVKPAKNLEVSLDAQVRGEGRGGDERKEIREGRVRCSDHGHRILLFTDHRMLLASG